MAAGQLSYNGITIGTGTYYNVENIDGLGSMPDVRLDEQSRAVTHGSFITGNYVGPRIVTITGNVTTGTGAGTTFQGAVEAFRASFVPQAADLPLSFQLPGQVAQRLNCKPSRLSMPISQQHVAFGKTDYTLELQAQDPRIYSDASTDLVGAGTASNAGTVASPPLLVWSNPGATITATNSTTGQAFTLAGIPTTSAVTVDFAAHTVTNATQSLFGYVTATSDWIQLVPGSNTLTYTGAGTKTLTYRSAWL